MWCVYNACPVRVYRYVSHLVYTQIYVHDCSDVVASTASTVFFEHTINQATKELNPVKEGYTLVAILIPYEPLAKGTSLADANVLSREKSLTYIDFIESPCASKSPCNLL